ncbi:hypothetical protein Tco_0786824, partial [Tanacetum coccineum]
MCVAQVAQPQVNPDSTIAQFSTGRAVGTIVQFGTSLSSLAQSLIVSHWFDLVDCHDYPSHGYHVISCVDYILHLLSVSLACILCLFEQCVQELYTVQSLRVGQALLQQLMRTDQGRGCDRGQEAEQKQVKIKEDRRDKVQAEYHVLKLQPEGPLSESVIRLRIVLWILVHRSMLPIEKKSLKGSRYAPDVRYISGLKRRLISVGQLDEEGYHVGFGDQQWKVTKGSLVVARRNKRGSLCMVEVHPKGIGAIIDGSGSAVLWFGEAEEAFLHNVREDKETAETTAGVAFGVAERLSRTFRAESTGLCAEAPKMLWVDSVSTAYLIYRIPYVLIGLCIPKEEWQGNDTSLAHLKMKCDTAFEIRRVTTLSEAEISYLWTRFIEPYTSKGSENSGSIKDSGRSDEEDSEDGASFKEGGSETPHVRRLPAGKKALQSLWMFRVKEEQDGRK